MSLLSSAVRICDSSRGPATARRETRRAADAPSPASGISSSLWLINRRAQWASLPLRGEGGFVHFPGVRIRVRVPPSMRRASAAVSVSWAGREPQAQSGQCPRGAADHRPRCPQARPATSGGFPDTSETRTPVCATRMSSRPLGLSLLQPEPDRGYFLRRRWPGTLPGRCHAGVHQPSLPGACGLAGPRPMGCVSASGPGSVLGQDAGLAARCRAEPESGRGTHPGPHITSLPPAAVSC